MGSEEVIVSMAFNNGLGVPCKINFVTAEVVDVFGMPPVRQP